MQLTLREKKTGLTKVYADDESYNSGHGHAYAAYGVDAQKGALVLVRPDHCQFISSLSLLVVIGNNY